MTDHKTVASRYIDLWNERAPARRREMLAANWTSDARYVDPLMSGDGHDGVDALVAGVQRRFPDFRFKLIGEPNGFGDHVRFSWGLGPDGAAGHVRSKVRYSDSRWWCDRSSCSPSMVPRCSADRTIEGSAGLIDYLGGQGFRFCSPLSPRPWASSASRKHRTLAGMNCRAGSSAWT